jgi:hypothetical protein
VNLVIVSPRLAKIERTTTRCFSEDDMRLP